MKRSVFSAVAAVVSVSLFAGSATAAVVLQSTAPSNATNIWSNYPSTAPLDLSTFSDYASMGVFTNGNPSAATQRPTGSNFGASFNLVRPGGVRLALSNKGPNVTPANFKTGFVFPNTVTGGTPTVGTDGIFVTYNLAANTTVTLNYYVESFNAYFEYSLTADGAGTLASLTTPTLMPVGDTSSGDASAGLLSFTVSNSDLTSTLLTFTVLYGGIEPGKTGANGAGFLAATAFVPEPTSLSLVGLGAALLLRRVRSQHAV